MARFKKSKRGLCERVKNNKHLQKSKTLNPFEVKVNKQKHAVFGKQASRRDVIRPGVSHSKAFKKRQATLLKEYKDNLKCNKFIDRRIGENQSTMSLEEKMMERYALEKKRAVSSLSRYNLDTDELTHFGQSLSEIEKFDDPVNSDVEDESGHGNLSENVGDELFGGFLQKKAEDVNVKKSWKERMQEMIANSKKEKHERQSEVERIKTLTYKVDEQWKELCMIMTQSRRSHHDEESEPTVDDYDITVNAMKFERTATASDRIKTEEELAKEEFQRLQDLEAGRVLRMSNSQVGVATAHRSADQLDDGNCNVKSKKKVMFADEHLSNSNSYDKEIDSDDDDDDDDNSDENDDDDGNSSNEDCKSSDNEDSGEDLESSDDGEDLTVAKSKPTKSALKHSISFDKKKEQKDLQDKHSPSELPYTFTVPNTYEAFRSLLNGRSNSDQLEIITRIRKCHHISLASGNREKLEALFTFLLQYFCDTVRLELHNHQLIEGLIPHIKSLCLVSHIRNSLVVRSHIHRYYEEFKSCSSQKRSSRRYPSIEVLMFLRLIPHLYPTTDFIHPIVTPTFLFMSEILSQTSISCVRDAILGLFICSTFLEFVSFSKRFVPEVINYLHCCLFLSVTKTEHDGETVKKPFVVNGKNKDVLLISSDMSKDQIHDPIKLSCTLADDVEPSNLDTDVWRLSVVSASIKNISAASDIYQNIPSYREVFNPLLEMLKLLPLNLYPESEKKKVKDLQKSISTRCSKTRTYLSHDKPKPKVLKLYECQVEDKFDGRKHHKGKPEQKQQQKLKYLHRKEMKGAVRELKRDSQFISRVQHDQQKASDAERKKKVKEIYSLLSLQEGEYNKLKRQKDRGK